MMKLNVAFFGTPSFVVPILKSLEEHYNVVAIVTAPDRKVGRNQEITPSPVKKAFGEREVIITDEKFTLETIEKLHGLKIDIFVVAAYGKIIPKSVLNIPRYGAINVHPSDLPTFRGASPIQATILSRAKESVVTIIKMDEEMDHGPVLVKLPFTITSNDTFLSLADKTFALAAEKLPEIISEFTSGSITPIEQDHVKATYCDIITKENGYINLTTPPTPEKIDRMIRAYYPWPGVWSTWRRADGKEIRVKFLPENMIQPEGKKPMNVKDFLNGYPEMSEVIKKVIL